MPRRDHRAPENLAREKIDKLLSQAGWVLQDKDEINLGAGLGVAIREVGMKAGHGEVDYLLYVDRKAAGVVEAKKEGETLSGVEAQSAKYSTGLPNDLPAHRRPLPFLYESTGSETFFTNGLEPDARSRRVFAFHKPETFREWLTAVGPLPKPGPGIAVESALPPTLRGRVRSMPPLAVKDLWPAQVTAITNLEKSLAANRPRALIQMATGSGKTFTMVNAVYRLIKYAGARRVLFLVDRGNLGKQAKSEFDRFVTPDDGRKFTELYTAQRMTSNKIDGVARVCITTIQRLFSMLKGGPDLDPALEEESAFGSSLIRKEPYEVEYNPALPIETFDVIITDECHRSIYNLWRQVLEYFDAFLIGLTATPSKQTLGFFNQNLVMEYNHERAVADKVNVDFNVYNIRTEITANGAKVEAGLDVKRRPRHTRKERWEQLDEELTYSAKDLDRDVVAEDQIRTVLETLRDRVFIDIFPGRTHLPKTLIYAKDDSHAEDIVRIAREVFGKGNDFVKKITYKSGSTDPEVLIQEFRNSMMPRIAVTVDMIATGTDIQALEIVMFMRAVKSRLLFEQMKGRGVRVIKDAAFQSVTPDAKSKTHFVIVDAVGACEQEFVDTQPIDRQPTVGLKKLLDHVALGNREADVLSTIASRLIRIERQLAPDERKELAKLVNGKTLGAVAAELLAAVDPDAHIEEAKKATGKEQPPPEAIKAAAEKLMDAAAKTVADAPKFRNLLLELKTFHEQTIDTVTADKVLEAGFSPEASERARGLVESWEQFIRENKDEIEALQVLYSRPYKRRLTFEQVKALAEAIQRPPRQWTPEALWNAYHALDKSKVRGSGSRVLTDLVSLVRFALKQEQALAPFGETVHSRFDSWMKKQAGRFEDDEQRKWLEAIRDHIATSVSIEMDDFEQVPFSQIGGPAKAMRLFGPELPRILDELNAELAA